MKGNESEAATTNVFSAKQRSTSRQNAAKIAHSMSEAQRQAKVREIGSHIGAATTVSPEQQQAAVKAAMVHAWRGVSCVHSPIPTHLDTASCSASFCPTSHGLDNVEQNVDDHLISTSEHHPYSVSLILMPADRSSS